jgi:hypothetical protein
VEFHPFKNRHVPVSTHRVAKMRENWKSIALTALLGHLVSHLFFTAMWPEEGSRGSNLQFWEEHQ